MGINATHNANVREIIEEFYTSSDNWMPIPLAHYATPANARNVYCVAVRRCNLQNYIAVRNFFGTPFLTRIGNEDDVYKGVNKYLRDKFFSSNTEVDPKDRPRYISVEELAEHNQRVLNGEEYHGHFTGIPTETIDDKKVVEDCPQQMYPEPLDECIDEDSGMASIFVMTKYDPAKINAILKRASDKMFINGYLFASDILVGLGAPETKASRIGGWLSEDIIDKIRLIPVLNSGNIVVEIRFRPNILDEFEKFAV